MDVLLRGTRASLTCGIRVSGFGVLRFRSPSRPFLKSEAHRFTPIRSLSLQSFGFRGFEISKFVPPPPEIRAPHTPRPRSCTAQSHSKATEHGRPSVIPAAKRQLAGNTEAYDRGLRCFPSWSGGRRARPRRAIRYRAIQDERGVVNGGMEA